VADDKVYGDEHFIYLMDIEDNPPHENNILDGYIISNDEKVPFKRRLIYNSRVSVIMPESFVIMPKELAQMKYPSMQRPDEIYTNNETTINFTVSHKNDKASNEDIPYAKDAIQKAVMRIHAASRVIDSETIEASGLNIAYFDFATPALDMDIYNVLFFFSLDGRIMLGSFNCPQHDMDVWKPVVAQMLESVELSKR
jgi:hypothetical protein